MTLRLRSSPSDFDFAFGDWVVRHRYLTQRLAGSDGTPGEWMEFGGTMSTRPDRSAAWATSKTTF